MLLLFEQKKDLQQNLFCKKPTGIGQNLSNAGSEHSSGRANQMNYRALIFDDDRAIRQVLWKFFDRKGYEIFTFPNPGICPLSDEKICPCPEDQACADIIISDIKMPFMNGLDFIDEQIKKGCKCNHLALMSGSFTDEYLTKAKSLEIKIFTKPFKLTEIEEWIESIEKNIDPNRKLADWYLSRINKQENAT
jgi:DNA-binding NtrC family response regulator